MHLFECEATFEADPDAVLEGVDRRGPLARVGCQ